MPMKKFFSGENPPPPRGGGWGGGWGRSAGKNVSSCTPPPSLPLEGGVAMPPCLRMIQRPLIMEPRCPAANCYPSKVDLQGKPKAIVLGGALNILQYKLS